MTRASRFLVVAGMVMLAATIARAAIAPDGETTHVRSAQPGEVYRGVIVVRNPGTAVAQVKLQQTDYAFTADGRNAFDEPGTLPRSNARWLRLEQEQVSIEPGGLARVEYEVRVPASTSLTGTYWSIVMVQELPAVEAGAAPRKGMRLTQSIRHAIQIITEIGDTGRGDVVFRNARLADGGKRALDVDLENTGERWLRTDLWLELHDAQGRFVGRFHGARRRTFPGTSVRNHIELDSAPRGRYVGLLVADGGRDDLFGMQIDLDLR